MNIIYVISIIAAGIVGGLFIGFFLRKKLVESRFETIEQHSKKILAEAEKEAGTTRREAALQAKDTLYQMKVEFEKETKEKKKEIGLREKRFHKKEELFDKKMELVEKREEKVVDKEKNIDRIEGDIKRKDKEYNQLIVDQRMQLEKIAGMSGDEAKLTLIKSMEDEARHDGVKTIRRIENEAKADADRKAQEIIALAVKKYSGDYAAERIVSVVNLPNEEMKGRIIGREGRNIRAIEAATGIDLIIDDTPEAVILSGFNPVRRQVAKISLERLI